MALLLDIEHWKALHLQERRGKAGKNAARDGWKALYGAVAAETDTEVLERILVLAGFGTAGEHDTAQVRARGATAVLRFLLPDAWGTVDWRTIAVLGLPQTAACAASERWDL